MDEPAELDHLGRRERRAAGGALDEDLAIFAADAGEIGAEAVADPLLGEESALEAAVLEHRVDAIVMRDEDAFGMGALEEAAARVERAPARAIERDEIGGQRAGGDAVDDDVALFVPDEIEGAGRIERLRQHAEAASARSRLDRRVVERGDRVVAQNFVVIDSCHEHAVQN